MRPPCSGDPALPRQWEVHPWPLQVLERFGGSRVLGLWLWAYCRLLAVEAAVAHILEPLAKARVCSCSRGMGQAAQMSKDASFWLGRAQASGFRERRNLARDEDQPCFEQIA